MTLKEFMQSNDLSALAFAGKAGVPVSSITRYLNGKRGLHPHTIMSILGVTGDQVTVEELTATMPQRRKSTGT